MNEIKFLHNDWTMNKWNEKSWSCSSLGSQTINRIKLNQGEKELSQI